MPGVGAGINNATQAVFGLTGALAGVGQVAQVAGLSVRTAMVEARQQVAETISVFERMRQLMAGGQAAFEQTQVGGIERLLERLQSAEESNPNLALGFSQIIENELERVASGQTTIAQAIQDLMRYLGNQYGLIQREFTLSTDASIRQLGQDILQFINSGQTSPGAGLLGARAPVPASRQLGPGSARSGRTTAGITGAPTAGAPTYGPAIREEILLQGEIRALSVTLTQHLDERIQTVLVSLQQQGNITPQQTERVLARLREVQSDFRERIDPNRLFAPLIEGQIRPMREEIRRQGLGAATSMREFSMELERRLVSGSFNTR